MTSILYISTYFENELKKNINIQKYQKEFKNNNVIRMQLNHI